MNFKQLIKKLAEMREASMPMYVNADITHTHTECGWDIMYILLCIITWFRVPFLRKPRTDAAHKRLTEDVSQSHYVVVQYILAIISVFCDPYRFRIVSLLCWMQR